MLLSNRIPSISYSPYPSIPGMKDLQNPLITLPPPPPVTPSLQYFNMRITQRLHRYRSLKRHWNEVASTLQNDASSSSKPSTPEATSFAHEQLIKDYINVSTNKEKNSLELDPLHSQIQNDLIELRKFIRVRQKQRRGHPFSKTTIRSKPFGETTVLDDQEKNHPRKIFSSHKTNSLNRVKISGCQMHPTTFPEPDSTIIHPRQSSSTCSNYPKQANTPHFFKVYRTRGTHHSLPSDSLLQGLPPPTKKISTPPKTTSTANGKQTPPYRLPMPSIIKKKQSTFIKVETHHLPPIRQISNHEPATTRRYTYAASTSSATPQSMKLNRKTSLLPILLSSSSCMGLQPRRSHSGRSRENSKDPSSVLLDYKHLISHLPRPVIPIVPRYDQGEYGLLFEQLDHIRETMPNTNVYKDFVRIC